MSHENWLMDKCSLDFFYYLSLVFKTSKMKAWQSQVWGFEMSQQQTVLAFTVL